MQMRLNTGQCISNGASKKLWDDFAANGIERELDEIDRIMRRSNLDRSVLAAPSQNNSFPDFPSEQDPYALMKTKLYQMMKESAKQSRATRKPAKFCVFCKNNGEAEMVYNSHQLKDDSGRVVCPILYYYKCPKCGAFGEKAHTLRYCPKAAESYVDSKAIRATARTAAGIRKC